MYTVPPSPSQSSKRSRPVSYNGVSQHALVDVDRRRIAHVLRNLVSNALNFTPTGGEVTISVRLSSKMGPKSTSRSSYHRMISRDSQPVSRSSRSSNHEQEMGRSRNNDLEMSRSRTNEVDLKLETDGDGASAESQSNSDKPTCDIAYNAPTASMRPHLNPDLTPPSSFSRGSNVSRGASVYFAALTPPDTALHPSSSASTTVASSGEILPPMFPLPLPLPLPLQHPDIAAPTLTSNGRDMSTVNTTYGDRKSRSGTTTPRAASDENLHVEKSKLSSCTKWLKGSLCRNKKDKEYSRTKKKGLCYLIVEVTDTGSGIAKENLDRIFKEIVQFNPNELHGGGHGGSGLGMVLSKGIVEAHGGKLWLTSEGLGKGCTFGFGLPISRVQTVPDHRSKADTAMQSKGSVHGSCSGGESGPRLGNTIDVHARNFHSSVVAALSGLDSLPRPYGPICGLMSPARKCLRPPAFKPETSIGKIASFREPLFNEGDQKGNQYETYPQETALNMSTLSTTPDESRVAREETDLSAGSSTSRSLTPRDHTSEVFSRSISLITADFIPESQVIASPSRIYNRDGPIHRRSQSADAMKPVQRPRSLSTVSPKHALIVEVRHC
jgi:Histidine kinase-, DNA gyrase B-, and HSP90-like ATPase